MFLCLSTSSPFVSLAIVNRHEVLFCGQRKANRQASFEALELLDESGFDLKEMEGFIADFGPGSFTGVKVGLVMVKSWGFALEKKVAGLSSFDLISTEKTVAISSVKEKHFLRVPGREPLQQVNDLLKGDEVGYGRWTEEQHYPDASLCLVQMEKLSWVLPEELQALYVAEPMISTPKQKNIMGEQFRG